MMRWNGFGGSLCFAAIAAAGFAPFALLISPLWGLGETLIAYAWLTAVAYPLGLGMNARRGLGSAAGTACAAVLLAVLDAGAGANLLAAAACLAFARSGLVYERRLPRALILEALLVFGGLAVAEQMIGRSTTSAVLAIWGFYLVQSVFFLVGGARWERTRPQPADPFDAAYDRALAVLDEAP
jgi:hypothetical protein